MNEPLMYEEARQKHGFSWRMYLEPDADAPRQRAYLNTILAGQLGISPAWYFEADTRPAQLAEHATRNQLVVKFCRLNRMLHWFCQQFDVGGPVFIVRHPCAVVASMLRHEAWDEDDMRGRSRAEHALHGGPLPDSLQDVFGPVLERIETRVEVLATMWCLDHYVPLVHHATGTNPWVLVPYERMVTRGREELRRITKALDVEMTTEMRDQLDEPSQSVKDQLHQGAERQLSKWRRRLSGRQVDEVLSIVREVGLDAAYPRDLEPNYDWLNKRQRPQWRW
ncbi:hypothetical protein GGP66_000222 [Salinibacter ruber]|uniref:hypothetical protein n=1 Tax=Salinibacter ruber TaxID=146919 RepID=UPI0024515315|nr:hypothetical protein [Salinibacter ruber]